MAVHSQHHQGFTLPILLLLVMAIGILTCFFGWFVLVAAGILTLLAILATMIHPKSTATGQHPTRNRTGEKEWIPPENV